MHKLLNFKAMDNKKDYEEVCGGVVVESLEDCEKSLNDNEG